MGPEGSTMHPLRALWEWYNIVYWPSLITNQNVNTRYPGSIRHLDGFKMGAIKQNKMHMQCNISLIPYVMRTFMSGPAIFKIHNSISDIRS